MSDPLDNILATREAELTVARDEALQAMQARPTGVNRKAYRKASDALEQFLRAKAEPDSAEPVYRSIVDVVAYLDEQGWKISKSTAYDHWKKEGKIKARPGGGFTQSTVLDYARNHLQKKDGTTDEEPGEDLARQKQSAEIRRILSDAETRELKLRTMLGELVPKSQMEIELSDRAVHLKNYLDAVVRTSAGRIIKLVKGDPQKASELISFMLGMNRKAMDRYSRPINGLEDEEDQ